MECSVVMDRGEYKVTLYTAIIQISFMLSQNTTHCNHIKMYRLKLNWVNKLLNLPAYLLLPFLFQEYFSIPQPLASASVVLAKMVDFETMNSLSFEIIAMV